MTGRAATGAASGRHAPRLGAVVENALAGGIAIFARALTGVRSQWVGCAPEHRRRIYFANHASNGDFVLLWAVLPPALRAETRPVAAQDYWTRDAARRFCGERLFRAVLIDRHPSGEGVHPVEVMANALAEGSSLIIFPEGTRNTSDEPLLPFKSGLYHLARSQDGVECVPVWIDNLNRVLPKGEILPLPLLCTVTFGTPLAVGEGEEKAGFLERARAALLELAPANRSAADDT